MDIVPPPTIHPDVNFVPFIKSLLKKAKLKDMYIDKLTTPTCMFEWTKTFTSIGADPFYNYELYEAFGDATGNKIVVWYYKQRFPEVFNKPYVKSGSMGPVDILSKLKSNGVSKKTFGNYGKSLGFDKFIRSTDEEKTSLSLEEDVFEAFLGCLETLIDTHIGEFVGYGICYNFMKPLMDQEKISLERDKLYDPISIMNEEQTKYKQGVKIDYIISEDKKAIEEKRPTQHFSAVMKVTDTMSRNTIYMSRSFFGPTKKDASKSAARHSIDNGVLDIIKRHMSSYLIRK